MKEQLVSTFLVAVCTGMGLGQLPMPQVDPGPVQAELLADLDARRAVNGKTIFARVTQDWNGDDCVLRKGAVLEGTVEQSTPRVAKNESKLALSFKRAQCNGLEMQPLELVLTVLARAPTLLLAPNAEYTMSMELPPPHPVLAPDRPPPSGPVSGHNESASNFTVTQLTLTQMKSSAIDHRFPVRENIRPGDVLDMKGLRIEIGAGPDRSSVIASKSRDVFLEESTQILLVPTARAFRPSRQVDGTSVTIANADKASARPAPVSAAGTSPPNDIATCAPPGCAVDLPVRAEDLQGHSASSVSTRALGYIPRSRQVLTGFADEESIAWLGSGQLLFTFNPHRLVRRGKGGQGGARRMIRAVLLDIETRNVVRAVDWEIADSGQYLWQLDGDRVLVHAGNELRVYRAGLEVERSFSLAGPLTFIRSAPDGGLLAVATVKERHSAELHTKLRNELGKEPEEDVDVVMLDREFNTVARLSTVSTLMAPTLLDEGQVRLQSEPGQWYRLAMSTWEKKKSALARFHSFCTPDVTSTAPNLLFLVTCNAPDGKVEYSVLRHDGTVLLRGASGPQEFGHEAIGSQRSRTFAVKIVHAERSVVPNHTFAAAELDSEEVRVFRAEDGRRLFAVRVKEPIGSRGGYALSPDGSQLAVLSASEIQLFTVPAE